MSSAAALTSSSAASPSSTDPANQSSPSIPANLYLFTFLATLCCLLLVSSTVTLRAIILRRRLQRQMASAGQSPRAHRSRRSHIDKPKIHDAWVAPGGGSWDSIMPISAQFITSKLHKRANRPSTTERRHHAHRSFFDDLPAMFRSTRHGRASSPPVSSTSSPPRSPEPREHGSDKLQVSVLVAMPSPQFKSTDNVMHVSEDDEISNLVFGVAHIPYALKSSM